MRYAGNNHNPTDIYTLGSVNLTGGGATKVVAGQNVTANSYGSISEVHAGGNVSLPSSGGIGVLRTKGNTSLTGSGSVSSVRGEGSFSANGWQSASGQVGGDVNKKQMWNTSINVSRVPGLVVDVERADRVVLSDLPKCSLRKLGFVL